MMNNREIPSEEDAQSHSVQGQPILVRFWSSTEYSGFLAGLMRELSDTGFDAQQCFNISEQSYRSSKSTPARLFLRFRQYVAYPVQLIAALGWQRIRLFSCRLFGDRFFQRGTRELETGLRLMSSESREDLISGDCPLSFEPGLCYSVAVVSTNTFYAPLLATYLHPNVVHLVYDLFPEAMIHSGKWTEGTFKVRVVRWITKQTLKRSKTNVFLGQRLKDYVESIHGPVDNSAIIAVGADQALFVRSPKERLEGPEGCVSVSDVTSQILDSRMSATIFYCGNFGNMHDSETLFDYWKQLADSETDDVSSLSSQSSALRSLSKIAWLFCCSGPKRAALETERAQLPDVLKDQIHLGGGLSQEDWTAAMESADVALVTMVPGSETVVMPSKTYSAMMAGQAILAIAPRDSDLVDTIKAADCGWFVEPGDVDGLAKVVSAILEDPDELLRLRENAFRYAHTHLGQDALGKDWAHALRSVIASP